ncbi:hypothetical protein KUV67_06230 [Halomonas denitrificans]|nr:hypothetical protein [Halomonas denitrificans]
MKAQTVDLAIEGNEAFAEIELAGIASAELTLRFEDAVGLSEENLGISVTQIDPLSLSLLDRLPAGSSLSLPAAFPLMITIHPPSTGGLSFEGMAEVELYTTALHYTPNTPLRLFKSSNGATFRDITAETSAGSYRVRGNGGEWSDFLIVADTRSVDQTVDGKFAELQSALSAASGDLDTSTFDALQDRLDDAYAAWLADDVSRAIQDLVGFENAVRAAADDGLVPNVWRSARDLDNHDGLLRARSETLRYSLGLAG